jgi:hypothetical protein
VTKPSDRTPALSGGGFVSRAEGEVSIGVRTANEVGVKETSIDLQQRPSLRCGQFGCGLNRHAEVGGLAIGQLRSLDEASSAVQVISGDFERFSDRFQHGVRRCPQPALDLGQVRIRYSHHLGKFPHRQLRQFALLANEGAQHGSWPLLVHGFRLIGQSKLDEDLSSLSLGT